MKAFFPKVSDHRENITRIEKIFFGPFKNASPFQTNQYTEEYVPVISFETKGGYALLLNDSFIVLCSFGYLLRIWAYAKNGGNRIRYK